MVCYARGQVAVVVGQRLGDGQRRWTERVGEWCIIRALVDGVR